MAIQTIHPQDLASLASSDDSLVLIDVRTPVEFGSVHVPFAQNVPLDQLDPADPRLQSAAGQSIYVICASGTRANQACRMLDEKGVGPLVLVEGGTNGWQEAGLPVKWGRATMSLERQVRIAAGSMVLVGVLGSLVHPAWLGLSAFVGAGLVFAGVTDTCGMAMLLGRLPWNRRPASCAAPKQADAVKAA